VEMRRMQIRSAEIGVREVSRFQIDVAEVGAAQFASVVIQTRQRVSSRIVIGSDDFRSVTMQEERRDQRRYHLNRHTGMNAVRAHAEIVTGPKLESEGVRRRTARSKFS